MPMLSETRERFAKAILAQVQGERIVEIHFFQPIKQGGVESGVAVLAALPDAPAESAESPSQERAPDDCVVIPAHSVEPPEYEVPISVDGHVALRAAPDDTAEDAYPPDDPSLSREDESR